MIKIETVGKPYMRYLAKVIPLAFDESMSYYEQVCSFRHYLLHEVMPAINNNAEAVVELQNYFENLDVQEEIDNKLDEMAQSGQLEEIIAEYLDLITNLEFKTVADMKSAENLTNDRYVKTLGFYSVGDGGASYYYIRNVTNEDIVDDHFIIALNDPNLVAVFVPLRKDFHSKQIGLKGDSETDETELLQKYFDYETDKYNKIVDKGIYYITNTLFIKSIWRQDGDSGRGYNDGHIKIIFDEASIKCVTDDDYSVIMYNMYNTTIEGLSLTSDSDNKKICCIGCWDSLFKNMCLLKGGIELNSDPSILGERVSTSNAIQHVKFENVIIQRGNISINPYGETTNYINDIIFDRCNLNSWSSESCVELYQSYSKQQLKFINCDLSGATVSVYDVKTSQVFPYLSTGVGSCSIITIGCYYDSNIPMFKNNNHNNIRFIEFGTRYSGDYNQAEFQNMKEYLTTTKLGIVSNYQKGQLPTTNLNLLANGDLSNHTYEYTQQNRLFGESSDQITKSYVANDSARYGYVRRLTFNSTSDTSLAVNGRKFQYTAPATIGLIFEVVSGGCDIGLSIGQTDVQTTVIAKDNIKSGINIITLGKNSQVFNQGAWSDSTISFKNITNGTVIDIYEIGVQQGEIYTMNAPLIESAKFTS